MFREREHGVAASERALQITARELKHAGLVRRTAQLGGRVRTKHQRRFSKSCIGFHGGVEHGGGGSGTVSPFVGVL